jgi:hypothetical protein
MSCEGNPSISGDNAERRIHKMNTVLLVILVLLIVGALPTWPYSASWGYYPSGGLGLVLLIVVILAVLGRL